MDGRAAIAQNPYRANDWAFFFFNKESPIPSIFFAAELLRNEKNLHIKNMCCASRISVKLSTKLLTKIALSVKNTSFDKRITYANLSGQN